MKKFARFIILSLLYVVTFILFYSAIPSIVWIFGGPFKEVAQSVPYVIFGGILIIVTLGVMFDQCFDSNFYPKR